VSRVDAGAGRQSAKCGSSCVMPAWVIHAGHVGRSLCCYSIISKPLCNFVSLRRGSLLHVSALGITRVVVRHERARCIMTTQVAGLTWHQAAR
jgi:hypothetical protein